MTQDELKRQVAEAALAYVPRGAVIGVGSGSTVNLFIDALARIEGGIGGAVSSSAASTARLTSHGIRIVDAAEVESLPVCVDGAIELAGAVVASADHRQHRTVGPHRHQCSLRDAEPATLLVQSIVDDLLRQILQVGH